MRVILVVSSFLVVNTAAHNPEEMDLNYEKDTPTLELRITHNVANPNNHYIEQIDIEINDMMYDSYQYNSQPSTSTITYTFTIEAESNDEIMVTAYCSIAGSIQESLTVESEEDTPPGSPSIDGPVSGQSGTAYDYTFLATDPEDHKVKYIIDWGDGSSRKYYVTSIRLRGDYSS